MKVYNIPFVHLLVSLWLYAAILMPGGLSSLSPFPVLPKISIILFFSYTDYFLLLPFVHYNFIFLGPCIYSFFIYMYYLYILFILPLMFDLSTHFIYFILHFSPVRGVLKLQFISWVREVIDLSGIDFITFAPHPHESFNF